jgi:hypothetical protein
MALLLLKLTLTPLLVGAASLAARRWGPWVGGLITAMPLTSGPVALYLALEQGTAFAATTGKGSLGGLFAGGAFGLAYGWLAPRWSWPRSLAGAMVAWAAAVVAISPLVGGSLAVLYLVAFGGMALLLRLAPPAPPTASTGILPPWDIPARMIVSTSIVLAITGASTVLGPTLSGTLAALPVYVGVLTVFAHHLEGSAHAMGVARGLQVGLFASITFYLVLSGTIESLGIAAAFGLAIVAVAAVQACSLLLLRRPIPPEVETP